MPMSISVVSRRRFLQCSLALGAATALPGRMFAALPGALPGSLPGVLPGVLPGGADDHIALLSDMHVSGGLSGTMARRLTVAVQQVLSLRQQPDKVLVAGDCAHLNGRARDYREYIRRIQPLVDAGLPMHMTMGNHDHRDRFWEALPSEQAHANTALQRQSMIVPGRHANWFLLDSLNKTNWGPGELGSDQLDWLAAELDAHADKPAVVMLHHDPDRPGDTGSLKDSDALLAIARPRRHVKALVFGHSHVWEVTHDSSGMHLINLPAIGYTLWLKSFLGWVDCRVHTHGATLHIHTLNPSEYENGQIVRLNWRAA